MALDEVTGDLIFGWYDGRNDKTFESVQYFGAVIPSKKLDKLVKKIPRSNPLYSIPSATTPSPAKALTAAELEARKKAMAGRQRPHGKKFRMRENNR